MTNVRSTADYFGVGADCGWTPDVHVFDGLSAETVESNIEYWCQYLVSNPLKPLKTLFLLFFSLYSCCACVARWLVLRCACGRTMRSALLSALMVGAEQVRDLPGRDLQGPRDRRQPELRFRGV